MASCLHELHQCVLVKPPTLVNCFLQLWQFCVRKCLVLWLFQICSLKGESVREIELWTTLRTLEWLWNGFFPIALDGYVLPINPFGTFVKYWIFLIRIKWIVSLWNGFLPSWTSPMCSCKTSDTCVLFLAIMTILRSQMSCLMTFSNMFFEGRIC